MGASGGNWGKMRLISVVPLLLGLSVQRVVGWGFVGHQTIGYVFLIFVFAGVQGAEEMITLRMGSGSSPKR